MGNAGGRLTWVLLQLWPHLMRPLSVDADVLNHTEVVSYGRVLTSEMSIFEIAHEDFVVRKAHAGIASTTGIRDYATVGTSKKRLVISAAHDTMVSSNKRIPGFFPMLGGPSFGPNALVRVIKRYAWERVVLYYQNTVEDQSAAETFVTLALEQNVGFELQKRESSGADSARTDFKSLQAAKSNIFIFFGGSIADCVQSMRSEHHTHLFGPRRCCAQSVDAVRPERALPAIYCVSIYGSDDCSQRGPVA